MLQPPEVLSSSLFVDSSLIGSLECIICTNVLNDPVQCRNGHGFCRDCLVEAMRIKKQCPTCSVSLSPTTISSSLLVRNLIENAPVYCFTRLEALEAANIGNRSNAVIELDTDDDNGGIDKVTGMKRPTGFESSSSSSAKRSKTDHCTWTGKLLDVKAHFNECMYAGETCKFKGCDVIVMRKDMAEHAASCPQRTQPCTWCHALFPVIELTQHRIHCNKRNVPCINIGCGAVMPFDMRGQHVEFVCPFEMVPCPYSSMGCNEMMLRKDIQSHEKERMMEHNQLLLREMLFMRQQLTNQEEKIDVLQEMVDIPLHEVRFSLNLSLFTRDGVIEKHSEQTSIGNYKVVISVDKGKLDNGNYCGVYLGLADGPFPCRVSCTFEVLHWDGNTESIRKKQVRNLSYLQPGAWGASKMIRLKKLTSIAAPYVQNGKVTFVATFRILPPDVEEEEEVEVVDN